MKVTFYGSIAVAAIAAQTAKADGFYDEQEGDSLAQLYDESPAGYADTEATSLVELESGDEENSPNWAELEGESDLGDEGVDLAEVEGKKVKMKKSLPKAGKKAKLTNMKIQSKAKIASAKEKAKKKVDSKKTVVNKRKARVAVRKQNINKKVRAQKNASAMKRKTLLAKNKADKKRKSIM